MLCPEFQLVVSFSLSYTVLLYHLVSLPYSLSPSLLVTKELKCMSFSRKALLCAAMHLSLSQLPGELLCLASLLSRELSSAAFHWRQAIALLHFRCQTSLLVSFPDATRTYVPFHISFLSIRELDFLFVVGPCYSSLWLYKVLFISGLILTRAG